MPAKKRRVAAPKKKLASMKPQLAPKLSKTEADLLWHMSHGYQLQTSSLWDNPILRNLKDNTELRATANRGTIEALQRSGLIAVVKDGSVLNPTVWRLTSKASSEVAHDTGRT
jgi:hypothetical protein